MKLLYLYLFCLMVASTLSFSISDCNREIYGTSFSFNLNENHCNTNDTFLKIVNSNHEPINVTCDENKQIFCYLYNDDFEDQIYKCNGLLNKFVSNNYGYIRYKNDTMLRNCRMIYIVDETLIDKIYTTLLFIITSCILLFFLIVTTTVLFTSFKTRHDSGVKV